MFYAVFDTEYNPSGNSNLSFHVGAETLSLLFLRTYFFFFHIKSMLNFDKATYLLLFFKFVLSERLSNAYED